MEIGCLKRIIFGVMLLFVLGIVPDKLNAISDKMILTAKAEETLTLTFKSEEGYILGEKDKKEYSCQITKGMTLMANSNFMSTGNRPNYVLVGWKIQGGDDKIYNVINGSSGALVENIMMYTPTEDTTFIAQWKEAYTVTFHSEEGYINGDKEQKDYTIQVGVGEKINGFPYVNREGYVVSGVTTEGDDSLYVNNYRMEEGTKNIYEYVPTGDVTFTVKWIQAYNVTFHSEEGYLNGDKDQKDYTIRVAAGGKINGYPYVNREGYVIAGVTTEGDESLYVNNYRMKEGTKNIFDYVVTKDMTFNVKWSQAYNVTFHSEEGYLNGNKDQKDYTIQVGAGEKINGFPYVNRDGYVISGLKREGDTATYVQNYSVAENTKNIYDYIVDSDVTFNVIWAKRCTVTIHSEEGYINGDKDQKDWTFNVIAGDVVGGYYPLFEREGYCAVGVKIEGDDTLYMPNISGSTYALRDYQVSDDVTFNVVWKEAYTITFYSETGNAEHKESTVYVAKGEKINRPVYYNNSDYWFDGWKIDGEDKVYSNWELSNYVPTGDMTFVAQWSETYKVTFRADEGVIHVEDNGEELSEYTCKVKKGNKIRYGDCYGKRDGYICVGWKVEGEETILADTEYDRSIEDYVPIKDVVLIAQWAEAYTITFKPNNEALEYNDDSEKLVKKGSKIGYAPEYICRDYALIGWKLEGDDKVYKLDLYAGEDELCIDDYIPKGNETFIGQWAEAYNITFHSEEGYDWEDGGEYENHYDWDYSDGYEVAKGKSINRYPEVYLSGYMLAGWKIEGDNTLYVTDIDSEMGTFICDYIPTSDVTFIAQWKKVGSDDPEPDDKKNETPKEDQKQNDQKNEEQKQQDEKKDDSKENSSSAGNGDSGNTSVNDAAKEYSTGDIAVDNGNKYTVGDNSNVIYTASEDNKSKNVTIPDTINLNGKDYVVTDIAEESFSNNDKLKKVIVGTNIKTIGKNAFAGCSNLTTVTIKGSSLVKVDAGAFWNCKKLSKITINKNVNSIGKNAFAGDKKLKSITIKSTKLKSIGKGAFKNINKKATIYVPKSLSKKQFAKYKKMFKNAGVPKSVKIKKK